VTWRLSPDIFWRLTPREIALALGPPARGTAAPARPSLDALMARFPDP